MAFKMKNPSMAKLTKAAGDNRVAMKMKMEKEAAATKMKKEAAMKMKKEESMAKLMDKASAMKMKKDDAAMKLKKESPVKKDNDKDRSSFKDGITRDKDGKIISYTGEAAIRKMAENEMRLNPGMTMEEAMKVAREIQRKIKAAAKMKKDSSMKMGHKSATKLKKPSPAKQKMNMVKGPDGKMVPDFAVDGKGANDMKSGAKMKKPMKMKKGEPMKLKKKDSAVKMVKAVRKEQKVTKIKPTQKPTPKNNKLKPVKQTFKKLKKPSVTAKL